MLYKEKDILSCTASSWGAFLFPKMKIKGDAYLDYDSVFYSEQAKEDCLNDALLRLTRKNDSANMTILKI